MSADLILRNGVIVTLDDHLGEVEALAVRQGRILAAGTNASIDRYAGADTQIIDLNGKLAIPGFIEGHGHFISLGETKLNLDLTEAKNWAEVVALVEQAVVEAKPGEWILGRGWHQEKWNEIPLDHVEGFPTHHGLSAISPQNPVCLTHASGHACFFNAKAMALADVDDRTSDPPGGEILRDASGQPTGLFRERAQSLVRAAHQRQEKKTPQQQRAHIQRVAKLADRDCLAKGVTSFQDAGSSFDTIDTLKSMAEAGELGVRLWVMLRTDNKTLERKIADYRMDGIGGDHLTVRAIKRSIDGALGSRGAWLLNPYTDLPDSSGFNTASVSDVIETARIARKHGFQLCVHAIGDRANREVLNIFERAFDNTTQLRSARWRVEHAQHLHPSDIPRFASLGVIASMQGVHCTSDAPYVVARLGKKRAKQGAYVWQKLLRSGAVVTNGTDTPVEDVSPLACFYSTVSRKLNDGSVFFPSQRMARIEALKSYTINCAFAAFEEDLKGTLTPGKLADIVVLSKNILRCPESEILDARVLYTIVGGKILHTHPEE